MKTTLRILLLLLICNTSFAQIVIRGYYYQPLFDFGYFMKPAVSAEIGYLPDFKESYTRIYASFTYLKLHPRQESFHDYSAKELTPFGPYRYREDRYTTRYQNYEIYQAFFGRDFALIKKERFLFYIGPGVTAGILSDSHTDVDKNGYSRAPGFLVFSHERDDEIFLAGLCHQAGLQFKINTQVNILASARTSYWFNPKKFLGLNQANDFGIGAQYIFEKKK